MKHRDRYFELAHAIQSAIAFLLSRPGEDMASPKHLRVGIDTAKVEHGALVKVLIDKGIITEDEYADALIHMMERELEMVTERARKVSGIRSLTFG